MNKPIKPEKIYFTIIERDSSLEDKLLSFEELVQKLNREIALKEEDLYFEFNFMGPETDHCYEVKFHRREELSDEQFKIKLDQYEKDLKIYNEFAEKQSKIDLKRRIEYHEEQLNFLKKQYEKG